MNSALALCCLCFLGLWKDAKEPAQPNVPWKKRIEEVKKLAGTPMTRERLHKLLGPPQSTSQQILDRRYLEQCIYTQPPGLLVELEHIFGEGAHIRRVISPYRREP